MESKSTLMISFDILNQEYSNPYLCTGFTKFISEWLEVYIALNTSPLAIKCFLTLNCFEQRNAVSSDPHGSQKVDFDLLLDVIPRLPLEFATNADSSVVDQCVKTWKTKIMQFLHKLTQFQSAHNGFITWCEHSKHQQ